ncbi:cation:proton antiporter [Sphingomonas sp.]|jgi:CPA2 family monovalent cation:H+ antiporter-2|uniref:cation:proton antiporter domain-containing protein n=1 Tax=Sphingomonas sp. TaxID=28214 RepID=UPI002D7F5923|nr:cation:proton antiporter [Sphingomonas sp.]HEU0044783.1 cation:proton antiporter [Sphingomonas sp.]
MAGELSGDGISDALVILGAAGLVIPAFARIRISPVIGFILVGILVGPAGLGGLVARFPWLYHITITNPAAIQPVAEIGIVLLLFSIGLELSFRRLWAMRTQVFGIGAAQLLLSAAVIVLALRMGGTGWPGALALALALALSSTALVLPITGTTSPLGRAAFPVLLFQDLALVPIVFVLGAIGGGGGEGNLLHTALIGIITVVVMYLGGRAILPKLFAQAARTKSPELFLAASLLVAIVASLATAAAGLSPIVGALLAGLLIAETAYHDEVEVIVRPFQGLALGVFLITVGMSLDIRMVLANWSALLAALVAIVAAKATLTAGLLRWSGTRWSAAAEAGSLLGSPGETTLIVLGVAVGAALVSPADAAFWQTATALGMTVTPLLARIAQAFARRLDGDIVPELHVEELGPGTVIIGFGRVGRLVAEMLQAHDQRFVAIDADPDCVAAGRRDGFPVLFGDVVRAELVERLALTRADALVLTMDDPALSVKLVQRVRAVDPEQTIIARARDGRHAAELYKAGVTDAVPETLESSLQLSEAVLVDLGIAMGPVIASIHDKREQLRNLIRHEADLDREPRIRRVRGRSEQVG